MRTQKTWNFNKSLKWSRCKRRIIWSYI